jgi:glycosyltransferase involved in cell wall biosynthesis
MRVAVDTMFLRQRYEHTGTAVYLKNLLQECFKICEANPQGMEFRGFVSPDDHWNQNGLASRFLRVHKAGILRSRSFWLLGGMALRTTSVRPDLVFVPTAHHSLPGPFVPAVITILDAMPKRLSPDLIGRGFPPLHMMTWLNAKLATKIITISEWSKRDLIEVYGLNPADVEVTYLGYDKQQYNQAPADYDASAALLGRFGIRRPFILHHGTLQLRKNVHRLIQAWDRIRERHSDLDAQLVLAGPMGFGHEEILRVREVSPNRDQIILTGELSDAELVTLIKNAFLCVIPSLYEGFCLPMVEAMACGVPTVASNGSCMPEVSGGILEYFDPLSVEQMAETMIRVLEDSDLRKSLGEKGLRRATEFSWHRCALETLRVFATVAQDGRTPVDHRLFGEKPRDENNQPTRDTADAKIEA